MRKDLLPRLLRPLPTPQQVSPPPPQAQDHAAAGGAVCLGY